MRSFSKPTWQHTFPAVGLALLAGPLANMLLWPRGRLPEVASVDPLDYFSAGFIERASAFRGPQSWLGFASLLALVLVPLAIALLWPRGRDGSAGARAGALGASAVGAGVALAALLAALPLEYVAFSRSRDFGLTVQPLPDWLADRLLAAALLATGAALLGAAAFALIGRLPRAWPPALAAVIVTFAVVIQLLAPLVLEPLFAEFERLPAGATRADVERVAARSGVAAGAIYVVDAARRTTTANAYVSGLGSTKRVVLYDTLLKDFTPAQRRNVIAHEFGHARYADLWRGLLWFAIAAIAAVWGVAELARALARRRGVRIHSPAGVAMLAAAAMLVAAITQPAVSAFSRRVEARADAFALRVTANPRAAIELERKLTVKNLARPRPPAIPSRLLGTHPVPADRIGMAIGFQRGRR